MMQDLPIKEYLNQIVRRKNIVLAFFLGVFLITLVATLRQPKIYSTFAVIEIGAETPDVAFFEDVVNTSPYGWWSAIRYYETQYSILKSRDFLSKAAKKAIEKGLIKGMNEAQLTGHFQAGLGVKPEENSRLARIYFQDTDPKRAQISANIIADTFVDENLSKKLRGVGEAIEWLNERLAEVRAEKIKREEELQQKKREFKVVSLSDQENIAKGNLRALTESLNEVKSTRIELEAKYKKLADLVAKNISSEDLLGIVQSTLLDKLAEQLADLKAQRSELSHKYLEKHPAIVKVDNQMIEVGKIIKQEVTNEVSRLKTKYLLAKAEEDSMSKALEAQKLEALKLEDINREIADVAMVTTANQQVYETLLKKLREADLSSLVRSNNIRMVDRALLPGSPVSPDIKRNLLLALLFGLLGGIALALILEYVDDTLKTHDDLETHVQEPVLAIIPRYKASPDGTSATFSDDAVSQVGFQEPLAFLPYTQPQAVISEFYRTLRTNLMFSMRQPNMKKMLFVSTGPGEGKTVTCINVGVTLAQMGKRVLVIDLDFRKPKLHQVFQAERTRGITNVLLGELTLDEAVSPSSIPNLSYVVSGSIPPNPAEILASTELRGMIDTLAQRFDYVLIDSAPIAPVTDAVVISQYADGVVMVVRAGKTHRKAVLFARDQLRSVQAHLLGVVLNDVDVERSTYASYQYYKYGYQAYKEVPKAS